MTTLLEELWHGLKLFVILGGVCAIFLAPFYLGMSSNEANAPDAVRIGEHVSRVEDTERGITCYVRGPSGLSCLKTTP